MVTADWVQEEQAFVSRREPSSGIVRQESLMQQK